MALSDCCHARASITIYDGGCSDCICTACGAPCEVAEPCALCGDTGYAENSYEDCPACCATERRV